jgi:hypothetical protein
VACSCEPSDGWSRRAASSLPASSTIQAGHPVRHRYPRLPSPCAPASRPERGGLGWGRAALLVVGAYRDHEVGPARPLPRTMEAIRNAGAPVQQIVLAQRFIATTQSRTAKFSTFSDVQFDCLFIGGHGPAPWI